MGVLKSIEHTHLESEESVNQWRRDVGYHDQVEEYWNDTDDWEHEERKQTGDANLNRN